MENEIEIMKLCQHPNICKLIEEFETKDEIYLIMELVKVIMAITNVSQPLFQVCNQGLTSSGKGSPFNHVN